MDRKLLETFGKEAFTKSTVLKCRKHFKTGEWNVGISEEVIGCRNPKYQNALHQFKIEEAFYNIRACSLKAVSDGCKTDILHVTGYTITQILKMRRLSAELVRNKLTSRQLKVRMRTRMIGIWLSRNCQNAGHKFVKNKGEYR